jgi:RNA methyltransferase, TrmH family
MTWRAEHRGAGGPRAVTSLQNPTVKFIRSLEMRKVRRETDLFVAEGASILVTARENGWHPSTLVFHSATRMTPVHQQLVEWAARAGSEILEVSETVLAKIASKENPQNMLAVFAQRWHELPRQRDVAENDLWLALEQVRDPGNLGTIIRTADAVGASGVILLGSSCDPYAREAVRATMGSIFSVSLVRTDCTRFLAWRQEWPGDVVGTHLAAREDFRSVRYRSPTLLLMGSEGPGLSEDLARSCTRLVKIPMAGGPDSLNLAIATALTLYQIRGPYLKL